uniref:Cytochrome P450 n=1 Tax=Timema tahoe TaxID=61484 RepID=A0A7R9NWQ5_9NEOP|nr:unnamed protein product [Timema tahoe]
MRPPKVLLATLIGVVVFVISFLFFTRHFNPWVKKGVPCLTPTPFVGNLLPMLRLQECPGVLVASLYNGAPKHPYVGFFIFDR